LALLNDFNGNSTDKIEDAITILTDLIASFNELSMLDNNRGNYFIPLLNLLTYTFKINNILWQIMKEENNEATFKNFFWELNTFLLKIQVLVTYLKNSRNIEIVLEFWKMSSNSLQDQCYKVLGKFGTKIAVWNITVNKLDLSKTLSDKERQNVDKFWEDAIKGTSGSCDILKEQFKIKKQLDLEFEGLNSISKDDRYSLIFLCNIPEKIIMRSRGQSQSLVNELHEVHTLDDDIRDLTAQRLANLNLYRTTIQRQTDIDNKKKDIQTRRNKVRLVVVQYLRLETMLNSYETIDSFRNLIFNPDIVKSIATEEADLAENKEQYTEKYGKIDFTPDNISIEIKKLKKLEVDINREIRTMNDDLAKFIASGEDEKELTISINNINIESKGLEIKIQDLYHQYNKINFNARLQNCTSVTGNDTGLPNQQVELIKEVIVTELRSFDNKFSNFDKQLQDIDTNVKKQNLNYNVAHELLYNVIVDNQIQNI